MNHLRRQTRRVFGIVVAIQLATSFGAIFLLTRMGPAIATVAEENVESMVAIEAMLAAIAGFDSDAVERQSFFEALEAAERNVTETEEIPILGEIRAAAGGVFAGDTEARLLVVGLLRDLGEVNRNALERADREARRLADAGAWAAVFLTVLGFVFVLYVANRVDRRFVMPILEVSTALTRVRQGDPFRRCSVRSDSPEIQGIADDVNRLLDDRP